MTVDAAEFEKIKAAAAGGKHEVQAYVEGYAGGPGALAETIFTAMPDFFRPDKAKGANADFQYHVKTSDGVRDWVIGVHDGVCESRPGTIENPRVTMTVGLPEFLRMLTGQMNGMQAFLTGKVRLSGDIFSATKFETWFDRP
jgi:putative sterol carrier protein